jgi:hypothetical protein
MANYLFFVFSDCKDPSREKEYINWYSNTHIPDMLETPEMVKAAFFQNAELKDNQKRKFLALYEFQTDDLAKFNQGVGIVGKGTVEKGRYSELPIFDPHEVPREYVQITPFRDAPGQKGKAVGKYRYLAFSDCKDPSREQEYIDWYCNTHIPDMLETPGMIRAAFFRNAEPKENQKRKYLALYEFQADDLAKFNLGLAKVGKGTMEKGRFSELPIFDPHDVAREYVQIAPFRDAPRRK